MRLMPDSAGSCSSGLVLKLRLRRLLLELGVCTRQERILQCSLSTGPSTFFLRRIFVIYLLQHLRRSTRSQHGLRQRPRHGILIAEWARGRHSFMGDGYSYRNAKSEDEPSLPPLRDRSCHVPPMLPFHPMSIARKSCDRFPQTILSSLWCGLVHLDRGEST
ncbi:hypothetical protein CONLIGDRAFT_206795 [Coniochaeta ligniaria NRRL 30616]|uniref:Uncharacterized protein n=1 Tax=Coniochaeta ligniaria NRRL 30616 TaxID=1408157 RepID=A0A1J7J1V9_9PEZI|nr:hypothetical protein CONLIGDRAFT_206795 [Coniochaeta ligniaria NRRL 30616]